MTQHDRTFPSYFDVTGVPPTNVLLERLSIREDETHSLDITGVPIANILIERGSLREHPGHSFDITGVPPANVLIERGSTMEHLLHSFDVAGVGIHEVTFGDACPDIIFGEGTLCKIVLLEFTTSKQFTTIGRKQQIRSSLYVASGII